MNTNTTAAFLASLLVITSCAETAKASGESPQTVIPKPTVTQQVSPHFQTVEQTPDARAIAEVMRVGGKFWTTPNESLPQRSGNRTTLDSSQPLFRAFLDRTSITDDSLHLFAGLSQLNGLYLQGTRITDEGLSHLINLPKLENLYLHNTQISDAGLVYLKQLPSLQVLFLEGTKVTDKGLEILGCLTNLDRLSLSDTQITDAGMKHLENLSKLNGFYVQNTAVGNAVTELARKLPNLGIIYLGKTRITDAGLANLKDLIQLDMVVLKGTKITDSGLKHLSGLTQLDRLLLDDTQVSDAGLKHLEKLSALTVLSLSGTKVTEAGISEFQKCHPNCRVSSSFAGGMSGRSLPPGIRRTVAAPLPKLADPSLLRYEKLEVKRVCNGNSSGTNNYKYVPDNRAHSMLLELHSIDLSKASELRFEVKKDSVYGHIKITLRDFGNLISDSIDVSAFITGDHDGYQVIRIPAEAFKTQGWDMQSVKLLFIGDQTRRDKDGPSFSIRAIEAGFVHKAKPQEAQDKPMGRSDGQSSVDPKGITSGNFAVTVKPSPHAH